LHLHGFLWLQGNTHLSTVLTDIQKDDQSRVSATSDGVHRQYIYRGSFRNESPFL
jgi:hypothetical protein